MYIRSFLDLMAKDDKDRIYLFSTDAYRMKAKGFFKDKWLSKAKIHR